MADSDPGKEHVLISCPGCGRSMTFQEGASPLICPNNHTYTLAELLLAQTLRVETLIFSAIQFLEQQKLLVQGLANETFSTQPVNSAKLEGHAGRIGETIAELRRINARKNTGENDITRFTRPN